MTKTVSKTNCHGEKTLDISGALRDSDVVKLGRENLDRLARDNISRYLAELPDRILTREEEQELGYRIRQGDEDAREELICYNQRLVVSIAKKYLGFNTPLEDLIQQGNIGLIEAVDRYNPDLGYKFSTYAYVWIKKEINEIVSEVEHPTITYTANSLLYRIKKLEQNLIGTETHEEKVQWLAEQLDEDKEHIELLIQIRNQNNSLDSLVYADSEDTFLDKLEDETQHVDSDARVRIIFESLIQTAKKILPERYYDIFLARQSGINGKKKTFRELARAQKVSASRIDQIEKEAIRILKSDDRIRNLWDELRKLLQKGKTNSSTLF